MAARDIIVIAAMIFAFALSVFVLHNVIGQTVDRLVLNPTINASEPTKDTFNSITTNVTSRFDYLVFGLFIGFILAIIITGWLVGGHPIFMFVYFIIVVIAVVLATVFNFVWDSVTGASIFGTTIASFTYANNILSNLPLYVAIVGFLGIVVMFAKPYMVGQQ